jgi:hypothetical protein
VTCRIFVIYDRNRTQGLSADDLIDSISALYGIPTRPVANIRTGSSVSKHMDSLAQEAITEGARLDFVERPQREIDQKKREADTERADAEKARVVNLPDFRP